MTPTEAITRELKKLNRTIELPDLVPFLGYRELRCSLLEVEYAHQTRGDRIICTLAPDEPWAYRSAHDPSDRGGIVQLLRTREGKGPRETLERLRHWCAEGREASTRQVGDADWQERFRRADAMRRANVMFLESKGISRETLDAPPFRHSLFTPPPQDLGRSRTEVVWSTPEFRSVVQDGESFFFPQRFIIAPNVLTALSHYQVHRPAPDASIAYGALVGRATPNLGAQLEDLFKTLDRGAHVVVATSRNEQGRQFSEQVRQIVERTPHVGSLHHQNDIPTLARTWNEQLQLSRAQALPSRTLADARADSARQLAQPLAQTGIRPLGQPEATNLRPKRALQR